MKKTICLITEWYPTKENPYRGLFFREQAFAVSDSYDFLVVRYSEKARKKPWLKTRVLSGNCEKNTSEYSVNTWLPLRMILLDTLVTFKRKYISKNLTDGVGAYLSESHKKFTRRKITQVFDEHFKDRFDVLYCVDAQQEAFFLQCLAEHYGKPYVIGEHGPVPWPGNVLSDVAKEAIEKANLYLAISQDKIRQMLLLNLRLPKTVYIGNLIDENRIGIKEKAHEEKTLLIMAAHSFYKHYGMFIRVMDRLKQITGYPFKIMIVGYASNKGYSKNTEEFEKSIRESSFASITEMIPSVPHEQIGDVLNRADAFVMTSIQEGQPVSAMEAACCGLPIFSTRCGGVEDYVDETIGRIYAIDDVEGMAAGLKEFIEGRITFDAEQIRKKVVDLFGKKAFAAKFTEAFDSVINGKGQTENP